MSDNDSYSTPAISNYGHDEAMADAQNLYEWSGRGGHFIAGRAAANRLLAYIERLEAGQAKYAALREAARAVRIHVGVLYDHPSGWRCGVCGRTADDGHLPSCAWHRFIAALADLEASDD